MYTYKVSFSGSRNEIGKKRSMTNAYIIAKLLKMFCPIHLMVKRKCHLSWSPPLLPPLGRVGSLMLTPVVTSSWEGRESLAHSRFYLHLGGSEVSCSPPVLSPVGRVGVSCSTLVLPPLPMVVSLMLTPGVTSSWEGRESHVRPWCYLHLRWS